MTIKLDLSTLIIIGLIIFLLFGGGGYFVNNKVTELQNQLEIEVNLKNALLDSVKNYKNMQKEWVAEKQTIQTTIKKLEEINGSLNDNQKELVRRIKETESILKRQNKNNEIISAALIKAELRIDSLLLTNSNVSFDTIDNSISFCENYKFENKEVNYELTILNARPYDLTIKPMLFVDSLYFPNKQFIEFHWKKTSKNNYPVSFSVTNSNDFLRITDIDAYVIPEIKKDEIKPTQWQKIKEFFNVNGKYVVIGGGALGLGWLIAQ